ncbi:hypothetical protein [Methylomagnum sp.]
MTDATAHSFWEIPDKLNYDTPVDDRSPWFVDTSVARGHFTYDWLYKTLRIHPTDLEFRGVPPIRLYQLLMGHRGCGKSTELRRLCHTLHDPQRFFVVFLDALIALDINNLGYPDILLALASALLDRLDEDDIGIPPDYVEPLEAWFEERVAKHEKTQDYAADIKTGISAETGLPFVAKLFAAITTSFRVNSTYKEEVRTVVRNHFSEFAAAFNALVAAANETIECEQRGRGLLFIVDGTDRLNQKDRQRFFIDDAYQLQQVEGNFIYCAPIQLSSEEGQVHEAFRSQVLPMIKLRERNDPTPLPEAYAAMRELVYRRVDRALFDGEATVDYLIEYSGGNPRHLIRLLNNAFLAAAGECLDEPAARAAVADLATDFRRILNSEDYPVLAEIDHGDGERNDDRVRFLLYNLALLEYNSFWRQTHPAVRTLDAYRRAAQALSQP